MYRSTVQALSILLSLALVDNASASQIGDSGTLSSLDGGLGGVVTVIDNQTLNITNYMLADASAPALYWWGSNSSQINAGSRISNTHITMSVTTPETLTINLDAGKSPADFDYVGLWCEQFKTDFGQTELEAATGASATIPSSNASSSASPASSSSSVTQGSKTSAGSVNGAGSVFALVAGAVGFAVAML